MGCLWWGFLGDSRRCWSKGVYRVFKMVYGILKGSLKWGLGILLRFKTGFK